jgi:hypothetical protein
LIFALGAGPPVVFAVFVVVNPLNLRLGAAQYPDFPVYIIATIFYIIIHNIIVISVLFDVAAFETLGKN